MAGFGDSVGDLHVDYGAAVEVTAQVGESIHRFQLSAVAIDVSNVVGDIGWRLMHDHCFIHVDAKSNIVASGIEEVHSHLHVPFCRSISCTVVSVQKFVDGGCGYTQVRKHPPLIEDLTINLIDYMDPGRLSR
ncbi:unnamed protein product [Schistocephalus solidus]|uniref:Protein kinase domain-containing protein n=1 Tax=Schistocephalus solidus TaxID=70667 RepID=A0A183SDU3_SCHSO|nr:unnamed protein product [Schistocephalus solidus]